jgi:hypothetical protein
VVSLPGYQMERHEFLVGTAPIELAPLILRSDAGTLILLSDPPGATVTVNGQRIETMTPTTIPLAPGSYTVVMEKNGHRATTSVDIHGGLNYVKLALGQ